MKNMRIADVNNENDADVEQFNGRCSHNACQIKSSFMSINSWVSIIIKSAVINQSSYNYQVWDKSFSDTIASLFYLLPRELFSV